MRTVQYRPIQYTLWTYVQYNMQAYIQCIVDLKQCNIQYIIDLCTVQYTVIWWTCVKYNNYTVLWTCVHSTICRPIYSILWTCVQCNIQYIIDLHVYSTIYNILWICVQYNIQAYNTVYYGLVYSVIYNI